MEFRLHTAILLFQWQFVSIQPGNKRFADSFWEKLNLVGRMLKMQAAQIGLGDFLEVMILGQGMKPVDTRFLVFV